MRLCQKQRDKAIAVIEEMEWNGTYLGAITPSGSISLAEVVYGNNATYWKLSVNGKEEYALVQQCSDMLPAFLDNLKEVFGLYRIGTHICKHKGRLYVLYRAVWDDKGVLEDVPLQQAPLSRSCRCAGDVSRTFLFRSLFAVPSSQASVKLRTEDDFSYPVSMNENKIDVDSQLPSTVMAWIGKRPSKEACEWFGIASSDEYHVWVSRFTQDFERVESSLCRKDTFRWLFDIFCKRLYDLIDCRLES